jgi:type II secretory pathway component PulF
MPRLTVFGPKIPLQQLSHFSGQMATCVAAGIDIPTSLRTCCRSSPSPLLREILPRAAEQTATGTALFDSLKLRRDCFPAFYLPVLRCGEESGHLDQTFRYLERHCRLLVGPARTMRDTWLVPLVLILSGNAISAIAYLIFAPFTVATRYIFDSITYYAVAAIIVWAALSVPELRAIVDRLILAVPFIGPAQRELAINRFFHALHLLYASGGRRVESMIYLAADSAGNVALRDDFLRAAKVIQRGGTISEAFTAPALLPLNYKATVVAGDEGGKLEAAFDTICRASAESVQSCLVGVQQVFFRVVAASVIFSTTMTLLSLFAMRR